MKEIGRYCFYDCVNISHISLPDTITKIGPSAFERSGIEKIILPKKLRSLGSKAFYNCFKLDFVYFNNQFLEIIQNNTFENAKMSEIILPKYCRYIGISAFSGCRNLRRVDLSTEITHIYEKAFYNCRKLDQIELPDSIVHMGENSLGNCLYLKNIKLPKNISRLLIKDDIFGF
jgi:hypothetical protein